MKTHEVSNQSPPLEDVNLYDIDHPLREITRSGLDELSIEKIREYGALMGSPRWIRAGALANQHGPVFHTHDYKGFRIDETEFHPSYHELMKLSIDLMYTVLLDQFPEICKNLEYRTRIELRRMCSEGDPHSEIVQCFQNFLRTAFSIMYLNSVR